jgi:hypothetical protein
MNDLDISFIKRCGMICQALCGVWGWSLYLAGPFDAPTADSEKGVPGLAAPEAGVESAAPKMAVRLAPLVAHGGALDGVGLWRLDVDGQVFLMVVTRKGVGLAPYVPAASAEGQD